MATRRKRGAPPDAPKAEDLLAGLTSKQRKFVAVYAGNGTDACRKAGYRGSDNVMAQQARQNLMNPQISDAIRAREDVELEPLIASRQERQEFWTRTMADPLAHLDTRLRASELLGKSEADFKDRVEISGKVTLEQLVNQAAKPPEGT